MKDYLFGHNKYLKYDTPLIIENDGEKNKNVKDEKNMKEKNIVRVIQEIRKNLKSNILYKKDNKNAIFSEPIYNLFPVKCIKEKKVELISYVSRLTNEEDVLSCLKKIYDIISCMYAKNLVIKEEFLDDLLSVLMELCRQVSVMSLQRGVVLKQLFNYNIMLLIHYHKLVNGNTLRRYFRLTLLCSFFHRPPFLTLTTSTLSAKSTTSSLTFNLKKQAKQDDTLEKLREEIEEKRNAINSLKNEIVETEEMIENERLKAERELSEVKIIYQNKIEKLKKNNQRKRDDFTRILQL
ncbi:dynein-associated protein [Plasmodium ovale curtisi]|uniref:Dynein-associated protein n=1 Tax=Plasmodium ovale curtisi TaxID=864141 RepID=A0A1A8WXC5_PLAOA|nr:dynein-associated protein [Plasmodium ovale curtisi]SBS97612.1 dynein-associated protein [Plasmodium ovale curtisi]